MARPTVRERPAQPERLGPVVCNRLDQPKRLGPRVGSRSGQPRRLGPTVCGRPGQPKRLGPTVCNRPGQPKGLGPTVCSRPGQPKRLGPTRLQSTRSKPNGSTGPSANDLDEPNGHAEPCGNGSGKRPKGNFKTNDGMQDTVQWEVRLGNCNGGFYEATEWISDFGNSEDYGQYRVGDFDGDGQDDLWLIANMSDPNCTRTPAMCGSTSRAPAMRTAVPSRSTRTSTWR